jgi:hypothetical protein
MGERRVTLVQRRLMVGSIVTIEPPDWGEYDWLVSEEDRNPWVATIVDIVTAYGENKTQSFYRLQFHADGSTAVVPIEDLTSTINTNAEARRFLEDEY